MGASLRPGKLAETRNSLIVPYKWEIQGGQVVFQVCMEGAPASDAYSNIGTVIASIEELVNVLGPDQPIGQVDEPENGTDGPEV